MLFSELPLDHRLLKSIQIQNLETATDIQASAIPHALLGKDILASSKTGSGKTLAYLVPAVQRIYKEKALSKKDPRALIVAPTRELAKQVLVELKKLLPPQAGKPVLLIGGENFNDQVKLLKRYPDFVIGTPGRVADHIEDKSLYLEGLEMLILDEADRILDLGFSSQLTIIDQAANHRKRQTLLFSATFDNADLAQISELMLKAPHRITLDDQHIAHADIEQSFYFADHIEHKETLLKHFIKQVETRSQIILFTATRADTDRIANLLNEDGYSSLAIHGEMLQSQRNQIMADFSNNKAQVLVTTDLASRGLDIPSVSLVINMDLPIKAAEYVHRVGRTGRAGVKGKAISLVSKKDWKSFILLKQFLAEAPVFKEIEGLEAKFKGLSDKAAQRPAKNQNSKAKTQESPWQKAAKKKKFNALAGEEVGHLPFKKKK
ncbi:DEAD/DEAH box helicase [Planctobacterium marinum]|uniref:RNA helicase n=1 Tax=Planctobacterium marinum TaxID=1631968 RepID=A0AA48KRU0_9ALTE|nr:RNA helicase [Planctobacterium marinum]